MISESEHTMRVSFVIFFRCLCDDANRLHLHCFRTPETCKLNGWHKKVAPIKIFRRDNNRSFGVDVVHAMFAFGITFCLDAILPRRLQNRSDETLLPSLAGAVLLLLMGRSPQRY
ncbi:hypothetical protein BU23DRAFT_160277 [Bimuria novae-zelandiae CBS 107.79]|uniref:Uncharacterized protein n=1 Tax=Bimuria novae-zelandiae CBS 107.79 TaxID=1447943 RepID=A0A6A5VBY7_9PLEO|nr:hypothetical protein BU23DRAFT_160277 [Bimuria novae-zelandiae CBS 107.79]